MVQPIDPQDDPLQQPTMTLGQNLQQGRVAQQPPSNNLFDSWNSWLNKPNNRAAMMQFGIAMLQPMGMGETGTGKFASALGSAGEAAQNVTREQEEATKSSTEAELRESKATGEQIRAGAAETRAGAAEQAARAATERTYLTGEIARQRLEQQGQLNTIRAFTAQAKVRSEYDQYKLIEGKNALEYGDWLRTPDGMKSLLDAHVAAGIGGGGGYTAATIVADPSTTPLKNDIARAKSSGNPVEIDKMRQKVEEMFGAHMVSPGEMAKLKMLFGL